MEAFSVRVLRAFWFQGQPRQVGELVQVDANTAADVLFSGRGELSNAVDGAALRQAIEKASARAVAAADRGRAGFVQTGRL